MKRLRLLFLTLSLCMAGAMFVTVWAGPMPVVYNYHNTISPYGSLEAHAGTITYGSETVTYVYCPMLFLENYNWTDAEKNDIINNYLAGQTGTFQFETGVGWTETGKQNYISGIFSSYLTKYISLKPATAMNGFLIYRKNGEITVFDGANDSGSIAALGVDWSDIESAAEFFFPGTISAVSPTTDNLLNEPLGCTLVNVTAQTTYQTINDVLTEVNDITYIYYCGSENITDQTLTVADAPSLSISASSLSFSYTGGQQTFEITSNTNWSVSSSDPWLTVSPASGSNGDTISVTATANTSTSQRTATVTVSGDGVTAQTVSVTQGAYVPPVTLSLTVSATSLNFAAAGGPQNFTITSNTTWSVSSSASWLTVSPASGNDNGTITVTAAANTSTSQRTATVTVSGAGVAAQTISVTQDAYVPPVTLSLTVSATSLNFAAVGGQQTFTITSNTTWSVSSNASWLTVSPASGSNGGTITVTAAANTSTSQRTATVTVSGAGVAAKTISITQGGAYIPPVTTSLTVSTTSLSFEAAGGQQTFTITSNTDWTVTAPNNSNSWLTISPAYGNTNGTITVTVDENKSAAQRTTTITVSGGGIVKIISVTQAPKATPAVVPQGKDPSNNGNGNKKGTIEINLSIPAEAMVTGSFEVEFPDGMTLDEQLTALSSGFSNKYKLTFTYMSDNTWLITIQSNGLKSGTTTEYIKIMDITYTVDNKVPVGDYEIWLKNIDLMMSDGTPIAAAWLFVPVHVRQTTGNETVSGNSFFAYPINNNMLRVHSAHKEYISVYSLTGVRFYYGMKNDDTVDIPVSSQPGTIWIVTGSKSGSIKVAR